MNPRVDAVKPNDDFTIELTFKNGEVRIFDMRPYLDIGIFKELRDINKFKLVRVSMGSILWQGGQDLCPDTLYIESKIAA